MNRHKSRGKVERIRKKIANDYFLPLVLNNVILFNINFFAFRNTKTKDTIFKDSSWLMRLYALHAANVIPLFWLQRISDTPPRPLTFLYYTSDQINIFVMINETVRRIYRIRKFREFEYFRRSASKYEMRVENDLLFLDSSDDVDVSVRNYNCFWIVWQVIEIAKLLNLIGLIFYIEKITMSLFDRKNRNLLNLFR